MTSRGGTDSMVLTCLNSTLTSVLPQVTEAKLTGLLPEHGANIDVVESSLMCYNHIYGS